MSLRSIANALGLSVTTVSRALADYSDVAEATRERVRAEAQRIGYVPNVTARRLQKGRADAIGLAMPGGPEVMEDTHFYAGFVGAWSRAAELGLDLVLLPTSEDEATGRVGAGRSFARALAERRVDGILFVRPNRTDARVDELKRAGLPFVLLGAEMRHDPDVVAIGTDHRVAAAAICERLAALGHRGFTCVAPTGDLDFVRSRVDHLIAEGLARGLAVATVTAEGSETGGHRATAALLSAPQGPPSAIVHLIGRMALGGAAAFAESPWVMGRHVSVIAFGDGPVLRNAMPPISAVQSPTHAMSRHAVDVLTAMCDHRPIEPIRLWSPTLIERPSIGPRYDFAP